VDDLKQINDSLGHTAGDTAIREVAAALLAVLGKAASVARVGGDEFITVIPSDGVAAFRDGQLTIPGASAGVAHYPLDGDRHPRRRDCSGRPSSLPAEASPTRAECSIHGSRHRSVGTRHG
jgi:hypothetical protein